MSLLNTKNPSLIRKVIKIKKVGKTSNGSKNIIKLSSDLPLQFKYKPLFSYLKNSAGRSKNTGRITVRTKGCRKKILYPLVSFSFRKSSLYFLGGVNYVSANSKITAIVFVSTGEVLSYLLKQPELLFALTRLKSLVNTTSQYLKNMFALKPSMEILEVPFVLLQQKKNSSISFIELLPLSGIQYTRSLGSKSKIIKLDTRTGLSVIKLSSGLKKVFSAFSLSSPGPASFSILRKKLKSSKSGDWRLSGLKSRVRGVAKNPVDHPHGGRTNSIKYPRTP